MEITNEKRRRDWVGNSKAIFSCHGASNHSDTERQTEDYYATPDIATEELCKLEQFSKEILEPAEDIICERRTHHSKILIKRFSRTILLDLSGCIFANHMATGRPA